MQVLEKDHAIDLYNRYGKKTWLHFHEYDKDGPVYTLEGNTDFMRVIYKDDSLTNINAIDPDGGPFMMVDSFSILNDTLVLKNITETSSGNQTATNNSSGRFMLHFSSGSLNTNNTI